MKKEEKKLLLKKLKLINNKIKGIENIKYKVNEKKPIPLLVYTPINCGLLAITKDIKVFIYSFDKYYFFIFDGQTITQYTQNDNLPNINFNKHSILKKYFINLILEEMKKKMKKKKKSLRKMINLMKIMKIILKRII